MAVEHPEEVKEEEECAVESGMDTLTYGRISRKMQWLRHFRLRRVLKGLTNLPESQREGGIKGVLRSG